LSGQDTHAFTKVNDSSVDFLPIFLPVWNAMKGQCLASIGFFSVGGDNVLREAYKIGDIIPTYESLIQPD
jgi:hypothetical protein